MNFQGCPQITVFKIPPNTKYLIIYQVNKNDHVVTKVLIRVSIDGKQRKCTVINNEEEIVFLGYYLKQFKCHYAKED